MSEVHTMNTGDGEYSYTKNSQIQREVTSKAMVVIDDAISQELDIKTLLSSTSSNSILLADLGCLVGPNTFVWMQNAIDTIKQKLQSQGITTSIPQFQVFFNDHTTNDFNTVFASLPLNKPYLAAGVPGSFHGRIHCTSAPKEVCEAYADQFAKDMSVFLHARAQEIVPEGILAFVVLGVPDDISYSSTSTGVVIDLLGNCLVDMAKEGLVTEADVDSFNLPFYTASLEEMRKLVERNGCFNTEKVDVLASETTNVFVGRQKVVSHVRAVYEGMLSKHFGSHVIDELFRRCLKKTEQFSSSGLQQSIIPWPILVVVLKRK